MEQALFPMEYLRVTQGPNTGSHKGSKAMDFGGKDGGADYLTAPFTCKIVRNRQNANGECYIESVNPVQWANGTYDYMHLTLLHAPNFMYPEGAIVPQGVYFYKEGGMGGGNPNKFDTHVHIEVSRGKCPLPRPVQVQNAYGTWYTPGQVDIESALFITPNTKVLNAGGKHWTKCDNAAKLFKISVSGITKSQVFELEKAAETMPTASVLIEEVAT